MDESYRHVHVTKDSFNNHHHHHTLNIQIILIRTVMGMQILGGMCWLFWRGSETVGLN